MNYREAITTITELLNNQVVICANGLISKEAFTTKDRPENFYMIGSMGMASSIGLGVALNKPLRKVIILEGDGNLLMNIGSLPMAGSLQPRNLLHIVLDNEVYTSTGNQPTISNVIELEEIAKPARYAYVKKVVVYTLGNNSLSFLLVKIEDKEEQKKIGRVTHSPEQIKERFMSAID